MQTLKWLFRIALFIVLFGIALHNTGEVTFNFYLGYQWRAPLILLLLVFFVAGAVLSLLAGLPKVIRRKMRTQPAAVPAPLSDAPQLPTSSSSPIHY